MRATTTILLATVACLGIAAAPASAAGACGLPGYVTTTRGGGCPASAPAAGTDAQSGDLLGGLFSGALSDVLSGVVSWVARSAADALRMTASLVGETTTPPLTGAWFSATYWRVGALSALLTLPFLFAACVHALVRGDVAMIGRAAFGYLPLAALGVAIAAPLTALLLAGTDEMCAFVSATAGQADSSFLVKAAGDLTAASIGEGSPFLVLFAAIITVAATVSLWLELLMRAAAVEVIVLMLPLFFAAMVWPARRVWAVRAIETLVALVLSKFAIVAVLTLGGSAIVGGAGSPSALLTGATIVLLALFSPWALLRLLPLHEVGAAAAGGLSRPPRDAVRFARDEAMRRGRTGVRDGEPAQAAARAGSSGAADLDRGEALKRQATAGSGSRSRELSPPDDSALDSATREGLDAVRGVGDPSHVAGQPPAPAPAGGVPDIPPPVDYGAQRPWTIGAHGDEGMGMYDGEGAEWFDLPDDDAPLDPPGDS